MQLNSNIFKSKPQTESLAKNTQFQGSGGLGRLVTTAQLQQLGIDTGNVLVPKLPLVRSKAQLFEEVFLELVEDLAFYFTVPVVGFALAKRCFARQLGLSVDEIGTRLGHKAVEAPRKLIAAKTGAFFGAVVVASAFEYMIQHVKNAITAKQFHIKNFTAVAGLEQARTNLKNGEDDPIAKAKRRSWQVGLATVAGLAASLFIAPKAVLKSDLAFSLARKVTKYFDFKLGDNAFDLSREALALIIGIGTVSYLDAARDSLERKETATRLAFVVPGLLFGKALASDAIAFLMERFTKVGSGEQRKSIKKHLESVGLSFTQGNPLKQAKDANTFLEFNVVADEKSFYSNLQKSHLPEDIQHAILKKFTYIDFPLSYLVSALVFGSGVCWMAFKQTKKRFESEHGKVQTAEARQTQLTNAPFGGQVRQPFSVFQTPLTTTTVPSATVPPTQRYLA